ncbi:MAG TPA: hypothetical protein VFY64_01695 [Nitrososphaeraceae archaeon]|nr:hypothetical protein [Nitrososphaeraceae archaeon]
MKNKSNSWNIVAAFAAISILIVTVITAFSAVLTLAINQVHAQSMNITEQKSYVTDVNVHFKTACISIIVFTYCW